jgi:hypothetical protein
MLMNPLKKIFSNPLKAESGATLLFVIILIVVLSVVGVGMFTLIWTSQFNQVEAQKSAKAYYISESCLRIAASEYKGASAANKNSTLVSLHNKEIRMPDNEGSCSVYIYPYWFYVTTTTTYPAGTVSVTLYMPGAAPPADQDGTTAITLPANINGSLKKRGSGGEVYSFSSATFGSFNAANGGTPATFVLSPALVNALTVSAGVDEFYLGYHYTPTATTLSVNGNLTLNIDPADTNDLTAKLFPPEKGSIFVESNGSISQYGYAKRNIVTTSTPHTVTLTGLQDISVSKTAAWSVSLTNTQIYMGKSLGLRSQSNYGD